MKTKRITFLGIFLLVTSLLINVSGAQADKCNITNRKQIEKEYDSDEQFQLYGRLQTACKTSAKTKGLKCFWDDRAKKCLTIPSICEEGNFYSCDLIVTEENTDCYWEKTGTNFCRKSTNCDTIDNIIDCNENPECFWEKGFGIFNKNECKPFRDCDDSNKEQCNANPKCYWTTIDTEKCSKREGAADACGDISNVDECSQTEGCSWSEEKCQAEAEIEGSDPYVPVFNLKTGLRRGSKYARRRLDNSISKERDLKVLIGNWSKYLLSLTAVIAVISIIWAGVLYITDFGDGSRKDNAKKILMLTVIGIVLIFGSYAIVRSVMKGSLDGGRADINFVIEMRSKANI